MNNDIILKAENLFFSYDDENSHSLNGLSLEIQTGTEGCFYGLQRLRKIHFLSVLQRHTPPFLRHPVF